MIDFESILNEARSLSYAAGIQLELVVQLLIVRELRILNAKLDMPPSKPSYSIAR